MREIGPRWTVSIGGALPVLDERTTLTEWAGGAVAPTGAGKCHQAVLINVPIRKIDQTLVPASVMPDEIRTVGKRIHRIEETLKTFGSACFFISSGFIVVGCSEKSGGWQLLGVTGNHQFVPAQNRRNSILRQHLTGLVEDNEVEILLFVVQDLADRKRTGHPTGADCSEYVCRLREN